jgi:hypothetical protein
MQDQRNHREQEKQVNQAASDVEHRESTDPRYQQYDEQNCPDAHLVSLSPCRARQGKGKPEETRSTGL